MSRFNHFMASHFGGCRLLAYARDIHRNRDVKVHALPGEFSVVGVTDGTDAWIAPVIRGHNYFQNIDVWQLLEDLREGKLKKAEPPAPRRRRLLEDEDAPPARRRAEIDEEQPQQTQRRRLADV